MLQNYIFTSESVSEGHPDKICDQISDALVDYYLSKDPYSRTAIETVATTNYIGVIGEVRCSAEICSNDLEHIIRQTVKNIGYNQKDFHWEHVNIDIKVHNQSKDIAVGVDSAEDKDEGAGDQGIMFGYAENSNDAYMPEAIYYSHKILEALSNDRHGGKLNELGPDAKSQVTLKYINGKAVKAESVVVSTQHVDGKSQQDIRDIVIPYIEKTLPEGWMPDEDEIYINPTGRFVIGGPVGDAGLTGRKIIVDTYGGYAPHGGGAFSGKDPTKVDRSAAYVARYLAKNIVAAGFADKCLIQLSYAIGVAHPISLYVDTQGTGKIDEERLIQAVNNVINLTPKGIRKHLQLNKPIYQRTAAYGHFGRTPDNDGGFSWEKLDLVDRLKDELK